MSLDWYVPHQEIVKWYSVISALASRAGGPRIPDQAWTLRAHAPARPNTGSCPAQVCWCEYRDSTNLKLECILLPPNRQLNLLLLINSPYYLLSDGTMDGNGHIPCLPVPRSSCGKLFWTECVITSSACSWKHGSPAGICSWSRHDTRQGIRRCG